MQAADIIETLGMQRHPEGGWYVETYRDENGGPRGHSTAIYYLLQKGERSHWHKVKDAAEAWHYYAGAPLALHRSKDGVKFYFYLFVYSFIIYFLYLFASIFQLIRRTFFFPK